jgi:hypothetical protein
MRVSPSSQPISTHVGRANRHPKPRSPSDQAHNSKNEDERKTLHWPGHAVRRRQGQVTRQPHGRLAPAFA